MVVFGGRMETQDPVGDLHILDVTTTPYTWSSGTSATQGRAGMACASAGNYFVAWGGKAFARVCSNNYEKWYSD